MANVARLDGAGEQQEAAEWVEAHRALSRLARERAGADAEEGRWLLRALRSAAHVHLGFGGFGEYIERLFGYRPRTTYEKLRVAEALEQLPLVARALAAGEISWSAARELTRVATESTQGEWLAVAQRKTVRELETLVAHREAGDSPSGPDKPAARRHVLRFEVAAETFALFREALDQVRRAGATPLDDDAALLALARAALSGPSNGGRSSYQIALSVCPVCGEGAQLSRGELVPLEPEIVEMARCDGQVFQGLQAPAANDNPVAQSNDAAEHSGPLDDVQEHPLAENAHVGNASDNEPRDLAVAPPPSAPSQRAAQSIPPALRRAVLLRDRRCCRIPGCRNTRFVDVHHLLPRSEGGRNAAENLVTLCGVHHRAVHRGELSLWGSAAETLEVRHAGGAPYGAAHHVQPEACAVETKVFGALRGLGFRESQVRSALSALSREGAREATAEALLRRALLWLTPQSAGCRLGEAVVQRD